MGLRSEWARGPKRSTHRQGRRPSLVAILARCALAAVALTLLAACSSGAGPATVATAQPTASPQPTTSSLTPKPTKTGPGPMTEAELAWLAAVKRMHAKVHAAFSAHEVVLTRAKMRSLSASLGECHRMLRRIGQPTARLRPVLALVKKACVQFDTGATCFLTAARVADVGGGIEAGTPAERTHRQAISCGFGGYGDGTNTLADAEAKGEQIKLTAG